MRCKQRLYRKNFVFIEFFPPHPPPLRRRFPFPSEGKAGALSAFGGVSGLIFPYAGKVENAQGENSTHGSHAKGELSAEHSDGD